jgi:hypothetical protein
MGVRLQDDENPLKSIIGAEYGNSAKKRAPFFMIYRRVNGSIHVVQ